MRGLFLNPEPCNFEPQCNGFPCFGCGDPCITDIGFGVCGLGFRA